MTWFEEMLEEVIARRSQNPRRRLNERDVAGFMHAADRRPKYKPQRQANLKSFLRLRNPWRWRNLQRDFKWAQKQLEKAGYDPEEIRWLL